MDASVILYRVFLASFVSFLQDFCHGQNYGGLVDVEENISGSVLLMCTTKNPMTMIWLHDNVPLFFATTYTGSERGRHILDTKYKDTYHLRINNLKTSDSGEYTCNDRLRHSPHPVKGYNLTVIVPEESDTLTTTDMLTQSTLDSLSTAAMSSDENKQSSMSDMKQTTNHGGVTSSSLNQGSQDSPNTASFLRADVGHLNVLLCVISILKSLL